MKTIKYQPLTDIFTKIDPSWSIQKTKKCTHNKLFNIAMENPNHKWRFIAVKIHLFLWAIYTMAMPCMNTSDPCRYLIAASVENPCAVSHMKLVATTCGHGNWDKVDRLVNTENN